MTVFDSYYKNLILAVPVTYNGSSLFTQNQNVGDARIQGVELEERWQVTPSFNIFGNVRCSAARIPRPTCRFPTFRRCMDAAASSMRLPVRDIR